VFLAAGHFALFVKMRTCQRTEGLIRPQIKIGLNLNNTGGVAAGVKGYGDE
jgi:hypothetical protein